MKVQWGKWLELSFIELSPSLENPGGLLNVTVGMASSASLIAALDLILLQIPLIVIDTSSVIGLFEQSSNMLVTKPSTSKLMEGIATSGLFEFPLLIGPETLILKTEDRTIQESPFNSFISLTPGHHAANSQQSISAFFSTFIGSFLNDVRLNHPIDAEQRLSDDLQRAQAHEFAGLDALYSGHPDLARAKRLFALASDSLLRATGTLTELTSLNGDISPVASRVFFGRNVVTSGDLLIPGGIVAVNVLQGLFKELCASVVMGLVENKLPPIDGVGRCGIFELPANLPEGGGILRLKQRSQIIAEIPVAVVDARSRSDIAIEATRSYTFFTGASIRIITESFGLPMFIRQFAGEAINVLQKARSVVRRNMKEFEAPSSGRPSLSGKYAEEQIEYIRLIAELEVRRLSLGPGDRTIRGDTTSDITHDGPGILKVTGDNNHKLTSNGITEIGGDNDGEILVNNDGGVTIGDDNNGKIVVKRGFVLVNDENEGTITNDPESEFGLVHLKGDNENKIIQNMGVTLVEGDNNGEISIKSGFVAVGGDNDGTINQDGGVLNVNHDNNEKINVNGGRVLIGRNNDDTIRVGRNSVVFIKGDNNAIIELQGGTVVVVGKNNGVIEGNGQSFVLNRPESQNEPPPKVTELFLDYLKQLINEIPIAPDKLREIEDLLREIEKLLRREIIK